jgi:hypothetical protein
MSRLGPSDTSPEAELALVAAYRAMSPARKWATLGDAYRLGRTLHAAGVRQRNPSATPAEIRQDWIAKHVGGVPLASARREEKTVDQPIDSLRVVSEVIAAFESLGIAYALGGSLASAFHGFSRLTLDADIAVEPFPGKEDRLAQGFGPDYFVSVEAIRQAIRDRSSFNIINTAIGFKVDVFIRKDRPFERSVMQRRVAFTDPDILDRPIALVSPEDIILLKLEWYRLGGEVSDRQWSDVLGVLRVQSGRLDNAYLDRWAEDLAVDDLLRLARQEAIIGPTQTAGGADPPP